MTFVAGSKLEKIGNGCFRCSALETIVVPSEVVELGAEAFCQCTRLKTLMFPEKCMLAHIGRECFSLSGLRSISLPRMVREIDCGAFSNCRYLKSV